MSTDKEKSVLAGAAQNRQQYIDTIEQKNGELNAFLEVFDNAESGGKNGSLAGAPIAVKDNILIRGKVASAASKMLENYTATYDATAITRLREAGAVCIGRTNMDEFAMGASTENSAFGVTKNPLNTDYVPGGSSGGSAAAVAAGMVPAALGSDTGGSIRQPASFCGVVGLKPSYGAVSRSGLIAMGSSLDQIGPIAGSVTDAETIFGVISGHDPADSTTLQDQHWEGAPEADVRTIGIPWDIIQSEGVSDEVVQNMRHTAERLTEYGYEVRDIDLPGLHYALSAYYIIMPAEVSANLARFDGTRYGHSVAGEDVNDAYRKTRGEGFGDEVRRRIMLGTYVLSSGYYDAYYRRARDLRRRIRRELDDAFREVDAIMTPTTPTAPFQIGEKSDDPLSMYMADLFTVPANIAGVPALSVPSGTGENGLPLGAQLMAPLMGERRLFGIGKQLRGE